MDRQELYIAYEHAVIKKHTLETGHITRHWSDVPEEWLFESGYINSFSEERMKRLMYKKEFNGKNRARDYGFDGMAKAEQADVYHSIQAKHYTPPRQVRAEDIGTFMAMQLNLNIRNNKSRGYLYTLGKLEPYLRCNVMHPDYMIRHTIFPWAPDTDAQPERPIESLLPFRPYQKEAIEFFKDKNGINGLNIPCRMGKTLIAGHHLKSIDSNLIIAIAPLRASVENLEERLASFLPSHKSLLVDSDYSGTTDIKEITNFLNSKDEKNVIYTTYKSAIDIISTILSDYSQAFILADEVHNASDDICDFINKFSNGIVLSATLPEDLNIDINEIYKMSFADAISGGYVVDYNLWLPYLITNPDGTTKPDIDIPIEFNEYEADLTAKVMYLTTVMLKTGSRRCIVYLTRQEECDEFNLICKDVFDKYHGLDIWIDKIDANVSSTKRREILRIFQEGDNTRIKIISSVRILDEAIDIPKCDSVFITKVGEHSSDIRMMQRSQRSSTKDIDNLGKKNNIFLWAEGWEKCINSLELLREADPQFFKKVRIADGNYDKSEEKERIEEIQVQTKSMNDYMNMKCMTVLDRHKMMIEKIKKFYLQYEQAPKQYGKRENEVRLAKYIFNRRRDKNCGKLSKMVEDIIKEQLPWICLDNNMWENHCKTIDEISNFYCVFNNAPKQKGLRTPRENILASYISRIRQDKKNGKLNLELEKLLTEKLPWFTFDPFMDQHIKNINDIADFYIKNKRAPVKYRGNKDEDRLGSYLHVKRQEKKKGKLSTELEELLLSKLPWFSWDPCMDQHIKNINDIADFYNLHNTYPKEKGKGKDENRLGRYINHIRYEKRIGKIDPELEELLLTKLPWFSWDPLFDQHIKTIDKIVLFYEKYKEAPTYKYKRDDETSLYNYISDRRKDYKNGKLSEDIENEIKEKVPWLKLD